MPAHFVVLAGLATSALLIAQATPPPGAVEGTVVNSLTGAPVAKSLVTLREINRYAGHQTLSDAAGRFRIDNVLPAVYVLWAEKQGFVRTQPDFDRAAPRANVLTVVAGKTAKDLAVPLTPAAVISGRVVNDDGQAVAGATVQLLRYSYASKGPRMEAAVTSTADDRGEYRIAGVAPGRWYLGFFRYIAAPDAAGRVHSVVAERGYGFTFHPGVERAAEAAPLDIAAGAEITQDLRLNRVRLFHIRGIAPGAVAERSSLSADTCAERVPPYHSVRVKPDGTFDFWGMTPGPYCLHLRNQTDAGLAYAERQVVLAERDLNGVALALEPGVVLRGSVTLEGGTVERLIRARVTLTGTARSDSMSTGIEAGGVFSFAGLAAVPSRIGLERVPEGIYLKAVRQGSTDLSATMQIDVKPGARPLEFVFGSDTGSVSGAVSGDGTGRESIAVTLAPTGPLAARTDLVTTADPSDGAGAFKIPHAAPGRYLLFAWELNDLGLAESPEFRALLESRATTVEVRPGESVTVRPTLITADEVAEARRRLR